MDISVYMFTGFLEAGKTTLIQETLADERFNSGEKTLILACEEGMEEYDLTVYPQKNVYYAYIETLSQLNADKLSALQRKYQAERIMVEYNGMWMNEDFYQAMPENWYIYQEIMLADATTFLQYNANMRSLVANKLQNCEMVVFNRYEDTVADKMALHKVVRGLSRSANIAYEHNDHTIEYDEIEDPLPFDVEAPIVQIADRDYALWYRDMSEDMEKYRGKVLHFTGVVARNKELDKKSFAVGRHVMTCCANDITYHGLICTGDTPCTWKTGDWVDLTARLEIAYHALYGSEGPILHMVQCEKVDPLPEDAQIATFN